MATGSGFFRSEEMTLCELYIQSEAAYNCVSELGELGLVQFLDLNSDTSGFQRKFVNDIRRCEEMERKIRFLEKEINKDEIPIYDSGEPPAAPQSKDMLELESVLEKLEAELREVNVNTEALKKNYLELTEMKHVLKQTYQFFDETYGHGGDRRLGANVTLDVHNGVDEVAVEFRDSTPILPSGTPRVGEAEESLRFVAGVILRDRIPAFERVLWRVCRGNVFLRHSTVVDAKLEDPVTGADVFKNVFIIFFQGEQLKSRVQRICEGFHATIYPCPEKTEDRAQMLTDIITRIQDLSTVLGQTKEHRANVLVETANKLNDWHIKVRKMKAIYHILNKFNIDAMKKCLIGECWCPVNEIDRIQIALRRGTELSCSQVPSILNRIDAPHRDPPTFHRTNKFTAGFQSLIDSYGVASYREMNPAPYTIISFPFLFGVMFGDIGHGFIMFLFALWMVVRERQLEARFRGPGMSNDSSKTIFMGRYIILLMGLFAMYAGFIYNDCFSKSFNVFGSRWHATIEDANKNDGADVGLEPSRTRGHNFKGDGYPMGMDPIWQLAGNKITFQDSVKMKLSVILGVAQMLFGLCLSLLNNLHKKTDKMTGVIHEFVPQLIFLTFLFIYMDAWIIYKWLAFDADTSDPPPPSILMGIINMVLFSYSAHPAPGMIAFNNLKVMQVIMMVIAFSCAPWMLLAKPLILRKRHKMGAGTAIDPAEMANNGPNSDVELLNNSDQSGSSGAAGGVTQQPFDFMETLILQAIHTIEYILGSVSHSASYLRLWALSLAHSQLSEVLWTMVLRMGLTPKLGSGSAILLVPIFAVWAVATIGILLLMEGLSAFLHALRLHWVEFQSKFYHGEGYIFNPFCFRTILESDEESA